MKIDIIRIAKGNVGWANEASQLYLKRIQHHWSTKEITLKLSGKSDVAQRKRQESEQIISRLNPQDRLILLVERGKNVSTETFAHWIETSMNEGTKKIVFAIGGPFGHDSSLQKRAWKTLAFSPMVLNHELARVVLAEQLYRVSTIIYGGSYHH